MQAHDAEHATRDRPLTSMGTIYAAVTVISIIISGGTGTIFYLNSMRNDLSVLQTQVVRDEADARQSREDQRAFSSEMRQSLGKIGDDIRTLMSARPDGHR